MSHELEFDMLLAISFSLILKTVVKSNCSVVVKMLITLQLLEDIYVASLWKRQRIRYTGRQTAVIQTLSFADMSIMKDA